MSRQSKINQSGFTLIELLVTIFITGILAVFAMRFYTVTNQQAQTQVEISDMQQLNRACLDEIGTALRSAGFGLETTPAFKINGDSLYVFNRRDSVAIDTVLYFTEEFTDAEYADKVMGYVDGMKIYKLMKKINSNSAEVFADYLTDLRYTEISPKLLAVTVEVQTAKADKTFSDNNGFRKFINTERVVVRNVK